MSSLLQKGLEELVELDVSLATGTSKPLKFAPSVATVITAEEIEAVGATTLDEALEVVPGLHVMPSNYNRLNSTYSMRGIQTNQNPQVLLLIDGQPIRLVSAGTRPERFNMSTANISRIEVIRGPGSALHGADAFAGTINVVTKSAAEINGMRAGIRGGSFRTSDAWAQYGGNSAGWNMTLNLDHSRSDGDNSRIVESDLQTALDSTLGTSASQAPDALHTNYDILDVQARLANDHWNARVWYWRQKDAGNGAGITQALDDRGRENIDYLLTDLTYKTGDLLPELDLSLGMKYIFLKEDNYIVLFPAGSRLPIGADGNIDFVNPTIVTLFPDGVIGHPGAIEKTIGTDLTLKYRGISGHLLRFGGGFSQTKLNPNEKKNFGPGVLDGTQLVSSGSLTDVDNTRYIFVENITRENWYALIQDEWSLSEDFELTAGLRYDHYSSFGDTVNPRLAVVWKVQNDLTAKLLYGRAFRPPAIQETSYRNNPSTRGNPNLDPETINTYELVLDYQPTNRLRTALNLFTYDIKGLIEFRPDPGQTTSTAQNSKDQEGHGFELEADWLAFDTLRVRGNMAYQRSHYKRTHDPVPDAPGLQFYANAHWKFLPKWSLDGQYYWIGDRHRAEGDTRSKIDDYDLVNLTLRRGNILGHLDLAFAVRNIFDEDIREPSQPSIPKDYPMSSRSVWGELSYKF